MRSDKKGRKKFWTPVPFILDPGKKIPKKNSEKFKKLKNLFQAIFFAKTGSERLRKSEKNVIAEFRSYSTPARKFQ